MHLIFSEPLGMMEQKLVAISAQHLLNRPLHRKLMASHEATGLLVNLLNIC